MFVLDVLFGSKHRTPKHVIGRFVSVLLLGVFLFDVLFEQHNSVSAFVRLSRCLNV